MEKIININNYETHYSIDENGNVKNNLTGKVLKQQKNFLLKLHLKQLLKNSSSRPNNQRNYKYI